MSIIDYLGDEEGRKTPPAASIRLSPATTAVATSWYKRLDEIKEKKLTWMRFRTYDKRPTATKAKRMILRANTEAQKSGDNNCPSGRFEAIVSDDPDPNTVWVRFIGEEKTKNYD